MLSGQIKSINDIPKGDPRHMYPRFSLENFPVNVQLVQEVEQLARQRGCTSAQLAINWVRCLSKKPGMPRFIPLPGAVLGSRVRENSKEFDLTSAEMSAIDDILAKVTVVGRRYPDFIPIDG